MNEKLTALSEEGGNGQSPNCDENAMEDMATISDADAPIDDSDLPLIPPKRTFTFRASVVSSEEGGIDLRCELCNSTPREMIQTETGYRCFDAYACERTRLQRAGEWSSPASVVGDASEGEADALVREAHEVLRGLNERDGMWSDVALADLNAKLRAYIRSAQSRTEVAPRDEPLSYEERQHITGWMARNPGTAKASMLDVLWRGYQDLRLAHDHLAYARMHICETGVASFDDPMWDVGAVLQIKKLQNDLRSTRAALEEARRDSARIDWLEHQNATVRATHILPVSCGYSVRQFIDKRIVDSRTPCAASPVQTPTENGK